VALLVLIAAVLVGATGVIAWPNGRSEPETEAEPTSATEAYARAAVGLGHARTFAYRGTVRASEPSPLWPGTSIADEVTVEGAVVLPHSVTREVAVAPDGRAVETVTSGGRVWSRGAASSAGLATTAWEDVNPPPEPAPWLIVDAPAESRLGAALLVNAMRAAGTRQDTQPDAQGRRVLRATISQRAAGDRLGDEFAGASVLLTLDDAGDVAHITLSAALRRPGGSPPFVLDLDIDRLGADRLVDPYLVSDPARQTLRTDRLGAASVAGAELGSLPPGWALVDAQVRGDGRLGQPHVSGCTWLTLFYRDLAALDSGWLDLSVTSAACFESYTGLRVGTAADEAVREPLRAGRFTGTIYSHARWAGDEPGSAGQLSDADTVVTFGSDLPVADAERVLASLQPFDPTQPLG
jgi:hypothetical protein